MFRIVFAHLLNDFSGSPRILKATILAHGNHSEQAKLYLGSNGDGILSSCGVPIQNYWYKRSQNRLLTFFSYFFSQFLLFFKLFSDRSIANDAIVYVNTLLPFGAALYGKITGRRVIYHIHEISITPTPLKHLLTGIAQMTSSLNLYVSDAHMKAMTIHSVPAKRIYNALDTDFLNIASTTTYNHQHNGSFNVLMISSLRDYKGIPELLQIASQLSDKRNFHFDLVINDDTSTINNYFTGKKYPANLMIHPKTDNTAFFYKNASLLLNLSRVDQCVETFGLTILEAMSFGIPVIAPPVGGPTELVDDGITGYLVDSRETEKVVKKILEIASNPNLCQQLSKAARKKAKLFSPEQFEKNILTAINSCTESSLQKKRCHES